MINFYCKFVPDHSTKLVPLYNLLQKGVDWNWSAKCEKAFQCAEDDLSSDAVFVHFDLKKPLVLSVHASPKRLELCQVTRCLTDLNSQLLMRLKL